ncbi:hypothetical protein MVEG_04999 [Podila verticillata NRRL 6337]|nr:MAG: hypothetical protein BYD32DRAFT_457922 [Podila humilis]KFH70197.1 hypothetical protein MVEG_04999 [Podila verticillata NRRL 6337]
MSIPVDYLPEGCEPQRRTADLGLSLAVLVGLFLSYLPQHFRIIHNKTSDGISPWFLLLGCLSATSSLLNILILQWRVLQCCRYVTAGQCFKSTLGITQLGVQSFMLGVVFVLYVIYYPPYKKVSAAVHNLNMNIVLPSQSFEWSISVLFAKVVSSHFVVCVLITAILLHGAGSGTGNGEPISTNGWILTWAGFLGTSGILLAMIQYIPQIIWTFVRKSAGALSLLMLLIQTPCTILMTVSLSRQAGANWSTWVVYAVTGTLQSILLVVCVVFYFIARRPGRPTMDVDTSTALVETTPLLPTNTIQGDSTLLDLRPPA